MGLQPLGWDDLDCPTQIEARPAGQSKPEQGNACRGRLLSRNALLISYIVLGEPIEYQLVIVTELRTALSLKNPWYLYWSL